MCQIFDIMKQSKAKQSKAKQSSGELLYADGFAESSSRCHCPRSEHDIYLRRALFGLRYFYTFLLAGKSWQNSLLVE
jgi:hypothetical protein